MQCACHALCLREYSDVTEWRHLATAISGLKTRAPLAAAKRGRTIHTGRQRNFVRRSSYLEQPPNGPSEDGYACVSIAQRGYRTAPADARGLFCHNGASHDRVRLNFARLGPALAWIRNQASGPGLFPVFSTDWRRCCDNPHKPGWRRRSRFRAG